VTLEDLYNGKTTKLAVQRDIICSDCNGIGGKEVSVHAVPGLSGSVGKEGSMKSMSHVLAQSYAEVFFACAYDILSTGCVTVLCRSLGLCKEV